MCVCDGRDGVANTISYAHRGRLAVSTAFSPNVLLISKSFSILSFLCVSSHRMRGFTRQRPVDYREISTRIQQRLRFGVMKTQNPE